MEAVCGKVKIGKMKGRVEKVGNDEALYLLVEQGQSFRRLTLPILTW
jgi:hypothetical protein